jgi:hypothetical protein
MVTSLPQAEVVDVGDKRLALRNQVQMIIGRHEATPQLFSAVELTQHDRALVAS